MSWYSKHLQVFEKPFNEAPKELVSEIRQKVEQLQSSKPLVSVVIIAHNEANRLLSCIWSLADNKHNLPIEIIGVNNCSTDHTSDVFESTGVKHYYEDKPGPGYARQCGLNHARGKYYLCIDGDSMYPPHYIETMVANLQKTDITAVFGLWSFVPDKKNTKFKLAIYEFLRDIHLTLQARKRPELSVRGMVFAFHTELGRKFGFRTDIKRGEDGSLALELKKLGKIKLLTTRKVRVVTSNGTLNNDGSLLNSFTKRLSKSFKGFTNYFTKETKYKDEDSNLL